MSRRLALLVPLSLLAFAPVAAAQTGPTAEYVKATKAPAAANITMELTGTKHHAVKAGGRMLAIGRIAPFVPNQKVQIRIGRKGHTLKQRNFKVTQIGDTNQGRFHLKSTKMVTPGPYIVTAVHKGTAQQDYARRVSQKVDIKYPDLDPGDSGDSVRLFTHLLSQRGYYTPLSGSYGYGVGLAVLAFRKENGMSRTTNATPGIFRTLARSKGGFKLKYPSAGKHVEVDISKQVMALADHGKAQYIFHVSTGKPSTPTITGHYSVYQKTPGRLPDGMYYSSFWHGGYAIHGYPEVPTYNASHGCVRVPEVDAIFIYGWLPLGTDVYTYY